MAQSTSLEPPQWPPRKLDDIVQSSIQNSIKSTTTASVKVSVFQSSAKDPNDAEDEGQSWGLLGLGTKNPMGMLYPEAFYQPPQRGSAEQDISDCVHTISESPGFSRTLRFVKLRDPIKSDYTFDIVVTDLGKENAKFEGTMNWQGIDYIWTGQCRSTERKVNREMTVIEIPKPEGLKGSLQELRDITPFAWKDEGDRVPKGTDLAQLRGDEILQKLMMQALDDETKRTLFPSLPALSAAETSILNDNRDFFKRSGVHFIAEQLKKLHQINPKIAKKVNVAFQVQIDQKITKSILYKWTPFMQMMTSFSPPTDGTIDPVTAYGWDRVRDEAQILKLQGQFQDASMRCYLEGYKERFPEWNTYLEQPMYWFKCFSAWIISPEQCNRWLRTIIDPLKGKNAISASHECLLWGNKLSLLKQAAPASMRNQLDISDVTDYLTCQAQMALAHAQVVDMDLVEQTRMAFDGALQTGDSGMAMEKSNTYKQEVDACLRKEAIQILNKVADPGSALAAHVVKYWTMRLPPGAPPVLTVGMVTQALQDEASLTRCMRADGLRQLSPEDTPSGWYAQLPYSSIVEVVLHSAAYVALIAASAKVLSDGKKAAKEGILMGNRIATLITEGLAKSFEFVKKAGSFAWKLVRQLMVKSKVATVATSVMIDVSKNAASFAKRFVHSLGGVVKSSFAILGVIFAIFSIYTAYQDAQAASRVHPNDRDEALIIFHWVQFGLNIASALLAVSAIVFQLLGWATAVSICGPIGVVIAGVMLVAFAVYYIWFRPDPYKDVKGFLEREAKPLGSYDESKEVELKDDPPSPSEGKDGK